MSGLVGGGATPYSLGPAQRGEWVSLQDDDVLAIAEVVRSGAELRDAGCITGVSWTDQQETDEWLF